MNQISLANTSTNSNSLRNMADIFGSVSPWTVDFRFDRVTVLLSLSGLSVRLADFEARYTLDRFTFLSFVVVSSVICSGSRELLILLLRHERICS